MLDSKQLTTSATKALTAFIVVLILAFACQVAGAEKAYAGVEMDKAISAADSFPAVANLKWTDYAKTENAFGRANIEAAALELSSTGRRITQIDMSWYCSGAVDSVGNLWTWGHNEDGLLGNGGVSDAVVPTRVLDNVSQFSFGVTHAAAVKKDGTLWTWGSNDWYEFGDGTDRASYTPKKVMENVSHVIAGDSRTLALKKDGSLWAWGWGFCDTAKNQNGVKSPMRIMDGVASVAVDAYFYTIAVIKKDGSLWMWGDNRDGQLAAASPDSVDVPQRIMDGVSCVSVGYGKVGAVKTDGSLWTWGSFSGGGLGYDAEGQNNPTPRRIAENVRSVQLGHNTSAYISKDGSLFTWGSNDEAGLGVETDNYQATPVKVMSDVALIKQGYTATAVQGIDGSLWVWGSNSWYQLGLGSDGYDETYSSVTPMCIYRDGAWLYGHDSGSGFDAQLGFRATVSDSVPTTSVRWDDEWFNESSYTYNHELATTAAVLSAAAYCDKEVLKSDYDALRMEPGAMYYDPIPLNYPTSKGGYDQVAHSIAMRQTVEGFPVVLVNVRGTPGNVEWISNANVANTSRKKRSYHEGFETAANNVFKSFLQFCAVNDINLSEARVLVTGHSRGASVANIVAAWLDAGKAQGASVTGKIDPSHVFAYTFESPTSTSRDDMSSGLYQNIFNIVNPEDFVAAVPLPAWGYGRFGKTLVLPSRSNTSASTYESLVKRMKELFAEYAGEEYVHYRGSYSNKIAETLGTKVPSANTVHVIHLMVSALAPSVEDFYGREYLPIGWPFVQGYSPHTVITSLFTSSFGKPTDEDKKVIRTACATEMYLGLVLWLGFAEGVGSQDIDIRKAVTHGHTQETYVSWMQSADAAIGTYPVIFRDSYRGVRVACPVDVHVYDEDDNLVASIEGDEIDESLLDDGLPVIVFDGVKYVDIPSDGSYRVEVIATDNGAMDCQILNYAGDGAEATNAKAYLGVELDKDQEFELNLDAADSGMQDSDIVLTSENVEASAAQIVTGDKGETVTIKGKAIGCGEVQGGGKVLKGAKVNLHSSPLKDAAFFGWYKDDELVSTNPDFEVVAEADAEYVARFEQGLFNISEAKVSVASGSVFTGLPMTPLVNVSIGGMKLVEGKDFNLSFVNNVYAGTGIVKVDGAGKFGGTTTATFGIAKAPCIMKLKTKTLKAKKSKKTIFKAAKVFKLSGACGKVTYKILKKDKKAKKRIVVAKNGKVTVKRGLRKGTYKMKVGVSAGGDRNHHASAGAVTLKIKIR